MRVIWVAMLVVPTIAFADGTTVTTKCKRRWRHIDGKKTCLMDYEVG
jgi:hypothetical protein